MTMACSCGVSPHLLNNTAHYYVGLLQQVSLGNPWTAKPGTAITEFQPHEPLIWTHPFAWLTFLYAQATASWAAKMQLQNTYFI